VSGDGVVAPASDAPSDVTPQPAQAAETAVNVEEKKTFVSDAKVGQTVEIFEGSFVGMTGDVKKLDNTKGIATIVIDFFGRSQEVEIPYNQFKLSISST
jgi:transcriptional antiterminator NusG